MLIGPILNKIQPFKNFKICKEMYGFPDKCPAIHTFVTNFLVKFLDGCILINIGPINTKLKDFVKLSVLFLNIWVSAIRMVHNGFNTIEHATDFLHSDWLYFLWHGLTLW